MLRRSLFAALGGAVLAGRARAASPEPAASRPPDPAAPGWFVQVSFEGAFPAEIDPGASPGRVEITMAGAFVACAWAPTYTGRHREVFLVPLNIGAAAAGRREDIKVEVYGELQRLTKPVVKITPIGA